ncbi:MAG: type II toxin-antitoxin system VapC family toxin [Candidatus Saccharimonadales bacterium]
MGSMYLLDTHVVLWALKYPERLGPKTLNIIKNEPHFISVVSVWEITIKARAGKLRVPQPYKDVITLLGSKTLPITLEHVHQLSDIKLPHNDPFDAMLIAQVKSERLTLITSDRLLLDSPYSVRMASL